MGRSQVLYNRSKGGRLSGRGGRGHGSGRGSAASAADHPPAADEGEKRSWPNSSRSHGGIPTKEAPAQNSNGGGSPSSSSRRPAKSDPPPNSSANQATAARNSSTTSHRLKGAGSGDQVARSKQHSIRSGPTTKEEEKSSSDFQNEHQSGLSSIQEQQQQTEQQRQEREAEEDEQVNRLLLDSSASLPYYSRTEYGYKNADSDASTLFKWNHLLHTPRTAPKVDLATSMAAAISTLNIWEQWRIPPDLMASVVMVDSIRRPTSKKHQPKKLNRRSRLQKKNDNDDDNEDEYFWPEDMPVETTDRPPPMTEILGPKNPVVISHHIGQQHQEPDQDDEDGDAITTLSSLSTATARGIDRPQGWSWEASPYAASRIAARSPPSHFAPLNPDDELDALAAPSLHKTTSPKQGVAHHRPVHLLTASNTPLPSARQYPLPTTNKPSEPVPASPRRRTPNNRPGDDEQHASPRNQLKNSIKEEQSVADQGNNHDPAYDDDQDDPILRRRRQVEKETANEGSTWSKQQETWVAPSNTDGAWETLRTPVNTLSSQPNLPSRGSSRNILASGSPLLHSSRIEGESWAHTVLEPTPEDEEMKPEWWSSTPDRNRGSLLSAANKDSENQSAFGHVSQASRRSGNARESVGEEGTHTESMMERWLDEALRTNTTTGDETDNNMTSVQQPNQQQQPSTVSSSSEKSMAKSKASRNSDKEEEELDAWLDDVIS